MAYLPPRSARARAAHRGVDEPVRLGRRDVDLAWVVQAELREVHLPVVQVREHHPDPVDRGLRVHHRRAHEPDRFLDGLEDHLARFGNPPLQRASETRGCFVAFGSHLGHASRTESSIEGLRRARTLQIPCSQGIWANEPNL